MYIIQSLYIIYVSVRLPVSFLNLRPYGYYLSCFNCINRLSFLRIQNMNDLPYPMNIQERDNTCIINLCKRLIIINKHISPTVE